MAAWVARTVGPPGVVGLARSSGDDCVLAGEPSRHLATEFVRSTAGEKS